MRGSSPRMTTWKIRITWRLWVNPEQDVGRGCNPAAMLLVRSCPSR
jgi:hypothetical protein